jgi:DNA-binding response OmpR family regulator
VPGVAILVIEDDQEIRDFLSLVLEAEGYAVRTAPNGAVGLDLLRQETAALIVLDMRMPVMNGWDFVSAYRGRPGPHAPILVLTAARDVEQTAREVQADRFLGKPFNLEEFLRVVRDALAPES